MMEPILQSSSSSATYLSPEIPNGALVDGNRLHWPTRLKGFSSSSSSSSWWWSLQCSNSSVGTRKAVIVGARKSRKDGNIDSSSSFLGPDETTGIFPESILLRERKVQEDGKLLPEFADLDEKELFEFLNLQMESDLKVERMRHYEVVYLVHEKHVEEVGDVNEKVEAFLREKKGKVWRFEDWGLRRLAYKIKKATHAHYILMNFELEAQWINDFKTMLDKDERVIRHLVMKRDKAITKVFPPPPEFHKLRAGMEDDDSGMDDLEYNSEEDYDQDEDKEEAWDEEGDMDDIGDEEEDRLRMVDSSDDQGESRKNEVSSAVKKVRSSSKEALIRK